MLTESQTTARALLPVFNAWYIARENGANLRDLRRLETNLWRSVAEHHLLIATDEILVGRWIVNTLGGRFDPGVGVVTPQAMMETTHEQ
jgi:hypothetical protein